METKQPPAPILLIPRSDGFLVVVDGHQTMKPMTATAMLSLSERCLKAGLEMLRQERALQDEC